METNNQQDSCAEAIYAQFEKTFTSKRARMVSLARGLLNKRIKREAEDVVQDAFVAALQQAPNFRSESRLSTWITTIVMRTAWARNQDNEPMFSEYQDVDLVSGSSCRRIGSLHVTGRQESVRNGELDAAKLLDQVLSVLTPEQVVFVKAWADGSFKGQMNTALRLRLMRCRRKMRVKHEQLKQAAA